VARRSGVESYTLKLICSRNSAPEELFLRVPRACCPIRPVLPTIAKDSQGTPGPGVLLPSAFL
jgi:hypothetical protein